MPCLVLVLLSTLQGSEAAELLSFDMHQSLPPGDTTADLNLTTSVVLLGQSFSAVTVRRSV